MTEHWLVTKQYAGQGSLLLIPVYFDVVQNNLLFSAATEINTSVTQISPLSQEDKKGGPSEASQVG